ncbi:hypothetical protein SDRG_10351 [Saprolegnia diclina VS20]|uniref:Uncharacterized protein n=1 Tax=Saprolegnia diclina (strain VS20) TaxID=1156394 RepID=T0QBS1_SAPDV|nr:hypothetical protein SDRG_10351 [Saprolegnia diclina VS20]EQC32156.1 hypothetical protein SDRG_10351 [Saprolegnia diclina VS20]|eukprot:XP_008614558.1 hypothetical protein SDRG_10351 [Saprolegnia diclina VS20]
MSNQKPAMDHTANDNVAPADGQQEASTTAARMSRLEAQLVNLKVDIAIERARVTANEARSRNTHITYQDDALTPLPKTKPGTSPPTFAPSSYVAPPASAVGSFPPNFPPRMGDVYRLSAADLLALSAFYNDDFGVPSTTTDVLVHRECFLKYIRY